MFLHRKGVSCKGATKINRRYAGLFFDLNSHFCRSAIKYSHEQLNLDIDLSDDVREVLEMDLEKFSGAPPKTQYFDTPRVPKMSVKSRF